MKEKIQSLSKILLCEVLFLVLLFLYTKNYLDLIIYAVLSIALVTFISIKYLKVIEERKYEVKCLNFLVSYVSLLNTYKNSMVAYNESSAQLKELNFNHTFEEVKENEDLLDELKLGENKDYVKNSINGKVNYEACEEMVKLTNDRLEFLNKNNFERTIEKFLYSSLGLLVIFPLIRVIFGEDLLNYQHVIFHVSSIFIYTLPLFLVLMYILRGDKNERKKD